MCHKDKVNSKSVNTYRAPTMCKIQLWVLGLDGDTKMNEMKSLTHNNQNQVKEKDTDIEETLRVKLSYEESWDTGVRSKESVCNHLVS